MNRYSPHIIGGRIMLEALRKTVQASVGAVVLTRERVRKTLDKLVKEGKLSTEEQKRPRGRLSLTRYGM